MDIYLHHIVFSFSFFPLVEKDLLRIINLQKLELLIFVHFISFFFLVFSYFLRQELKGGVIWVLPLSII